MAVLSSRKDRMLQLTITDDMLTTLVREVAATFSHVDEQEVQLSRASSYDRDYYRENLRSARDRKQGMLRGIQLALGTTAYELIFQNTLLREATTYDEKNTEHLITEPQPAVATSNVVHSVDTANEEALPPFRVNLDAVSFLNDYLREMPLDEYAGMNHATREGEDEVIFQCGNTTVRQSDVDTTLDDLVIARVEHLIDTWHPILHPNGIARINDILRIHVQWPETLSADGFTRNGEWSTYYNLLTYLSCVATESMRDLSYGFPIRTFTLPLPIGNPSDIYADSDTWWPDSAAMLNNYRWQIDLQRSLQAEDLYPLLFDELVITSDDVTWTDSRYITSQNRRARRNFAQMHAYQQTTSDNEITYHFRLPSDSLHGYGSFSIYNPVPF